MATPKEILQRALFGTPATNYGVENQAYLDELANQRAFQDLAQKQGLTTQQALGGVMQGLNYGDKNIAQNQQRLGIRTPMSQEQIELARQGNFNQYEEPKQGGFLRDLSQGYNENLNQSFNVDNLVPQNKNLATKIGEGLGTAARFIDKPIGRFALATGLSYLTDEANPLKEGVTAFVGRQKNQTADRVYRNQLKQLGMTDEDLGEIPGLVTKDIFEGVTSGMKLGNQRMTYGQLALFDSRIAKLIQKDPSLSYQFVPVNIARDIYGRKREKAESEMEKIGAEVKKTEAETKHVGQPKTIIHKSDKKGNERPTRKDNNNSGKKHNTNSF